MNRRGALSALASIALGSCDRCRHNPPPPSQVTDRPDKNPVGAWRDLKFPASVDAPDGQLARLLVQDGARDLPILIALHGRGESGNGLRIGAEAWPKDYELERIHRRLMNPPLESSDLLDIVKPERLQAINEALAKEPYRGMAIACPYAPYQSAPSPSAAEAFARWVIGELLPRVRTEAQAATSREATGIDGVSMGGRLALLVGLSNPNVFGRVAAMQPAMNADEAPFWSDLAQKAMKEKPVKLRLLTSEQDVFREPVQAVAAKLAADGVPHQLVVVPGEHGYQFNRGPGGAEMLLWHDRTARGLPPI